MQFNINSDTIRFISFFTFLIHVSTHQSDKTPQNLDETRFNKNELNYYK